MKAPRRFHISMWHSKRFIVIADVRPSCLHDGLLTFYKSQAFKRVMKIHLTQWVPRSLSYRYRGPDKQSSSHSSSAKWHSQRRKRGKRRRKNLSLSLSLSSPFPRVIAAQFSCLITLFTYHVFGSVVCFSSSSLSRLTYYLLCLLWICNL